MKATCGGCDNTWDGSTARAHCAACHHTFSNPRLFDEHRYGEKLRRCRYPDIVGFTLREGTWYDD